MTPSATPPEIFSRAAVRRARARAAQGFSGHDFLHRRAMADIVDRLETTTRRFDTALFYGAGPLTDLLTPACGVGRIVSADLAAERLGPGADTIAFDEEASPFAPESFDLIVSLLTLHRANDLVGALAQHRLALKPDGLFIGVLFGEETLSAFKASLFEAEAAVTGGASARIAPFGMLKDLGAALQRAGFALPVADIDHAVVDYREPARLLSDLRGMGESGGLKSAPRGLRRDVLGAALAAFAARGARAQFDMIYLTGWAPHPDQQKPLKPGSAKASLAEAVKRAGDA